MNTLKINRVYRHFKGDYYLVVDVAKHSETKEDYVIYRPLYGNGSLWVRPKELFLSEVDRRKYPEATQRYRFELQEIESQATLYNQKQENLSAEIDYTAPNVVTFGGAHDGYRSFLNDTPMKFKINGFTYTSALQYILYQKANLFKDMEMGDKILETDDIGKLKDLSDQISPYDDRWKSPQEYIRKGIREKFLQNPEACKALLDTGNSILAYANRLDTKWGIGLVSEDPRVETPEKWKGRNLLGYTLMQVRSDIWKIKNNVSEEEIDKNEPARIFVVREDITNLEVDAIVSTTDEKLSGIGDVDHAIREKAGAMLELDCQKQGSLSAGETFMTSGYQLPAKNILFTVGPKWLGGKAREDKVLSRCYFSALSLAAARGIHTIAFPSISTGKGRYPVQDAAPIAIRSILEYLRNNPDANMTVTIAVQDHVTKFQYEKAIHQALNQDRIEKQVNHIKVEEITKSLKINFNEVVFVVSGIQDMFSITTNQVITLIENGEHEINIYKISRNNLMEILPQEHFNEFMNLLSTNKGDDYVIAKGWSSELLGIGYTIYMRNYVHTSFNGEAKEWREMGGLMSNYEKIAVNVLSKF